MSGLPSAPRAEDRALLRSLAVALELPGSIEGPIRERYAAALRRYLDDSYPPAPANRPPVRERNYWIAVDYWIRYAHMGDRFAASKLRHRVRALIGIELTAGRIKRIAQELRNETAEQVAYAVEHLAMERADGGSRLESAQRSAETMWYYSHGVMLEERAGKPPARKRKRSARKAR